MNERAIKRESFQEGDKCTTSNDFRKFLVIAGSKISVEMTRSPSNNFELYRDKKMCIQDILDTIRIYFDTGHATESIKIRELFRKLPKQIRDRVDIEAVINDISDTREQRQRRN
ncbi:MAG: hypothetical protein ABH833_02415 [Parcubacteria group bacterium]